MKKAYIWVIVFCIISILIYVFYYNENYKEAPSKNIIIQWQNWIIHLAKAPLFKEIYINSNHKYDKNYFAFIWGSVIDINNDGKDEFFITGWANQNDSFIKYEDGKLVNFIDNSWINNKQASYGSVSIDYNNNGFTDLFVARENWIYLYLNNWSKFIEQKISIDLEKNSIPVDISITDFDKDGDLDLYISTFISAWVFKSAMFNNSQNVTNNLLLRNDWENNFSEVSEELGLTLKQNTFTSAFVDLNEDGWEDLVVSPNTDQIKIYRNNKWTFQLIQNLSNYGFWMWLAISDIDNDGDLDLFFSNTGNSIPNNLLKWDSKSSQKITSDYLILENIWEFNFTNITSDIFESQPWFWWGIIPVDFDLNNVNEYLIHQNYIKWPVHKLKKLTWELISISAKNFISDYKIENKNYGFSSLIWDLNNDGLNDLVYLNIDGSAKSFIRDFDKNNQYLKILLKNNINTLWIKATLKLDNWLTLQKKLLSKQGIMTSQSSSIIFWLNWQLFKKWNLELKYLNWDIEIFIIDSSKKILNLRK